MFGHRQSQAAAVDVCSVLAGSNPYRLVVRASRCGRQQNDLPKGFSGARKALNFVVVGSRPTVGALPILGQRSSSFLTLHTLDSKGTMAN